MQRYSNHAGPAEAHQQASRASTADDVAVLRSGSMSNIQVPEDCCFPNDGCYIWHIHMCRLRRLVPAGGMIDGLLQGACRCCMPSSQM